MKEVFNNFYRKDDYCYLTVEYAPPIGKHYVVKLSKKYYYPFPGVCRSESDANAFIKSAMLKHSEFLVQKQFDKWLSENAIVIEEEMLAE